MIIVYIQQNSFDKTNHKEEDLNSRHLETCIKYGPKHLSLSWRVEVKNTALLGSSNNVYILVCPKLCTLTNDKKLWPLDM